MTVVLWLAEMYVALVIGVALGIAIHAAAQGSKLRDLEAELEALDTEDATSP